MSHGIAENPRWIIKIKTFERKCLRRVSNDSLYLKYQLD